MTPPTSDLSGYYPVNVKSEYTPLMHSENMLSAPMRKLQVHNQMIDFGFNHVLGDSMPPSGNPYESTTPHALQHYPLYESMATATSFPMALPQPMGSKPPYAFNPDYDKCPPWPPQMTENHPLDYNFCGIRELSAMHIHISTRTNAPASVLRRVYMDNGQRRGMLLQKVHGRHEPKNYISEEQIPVSKISKAVHMCNFPGCEKQTGFKRREHLRRHQNT